MGLSNLVVYEDNFLFYVRKPHGVPTTYGKQKSFLEFLLDNLENIKYINKNFYNHLKNFSEHGNNEFLLLNRLDNDTAGLLYFAKNEIVYNDFKKLQDKGKIEKIYLVDIFGKIDKKININYPIMHHKYLDYKMIAIKKEKDLNKGRGKLHRVNTVFIPLYYDDKFKVTTGYAIITKGIRHQIRVHLASIGHPIVGDKIYSKYPRDNVLHLRSIGLKVG